MDKLRPDIEKAAVDSVMQQDFMQDLPILNSKQKCSL
jgi:hypothetical protein